MKLVVEIVPESEIDETCIEKILSLWQNSSITPAYLKIGSALSKAESRTESKYYHI